MKQIHFKPVNTLSTKKLPLINVSGTNEEIGAQLGQILQPRIISTLSYYKSIFHRSEEEIFHYANIFKSAIKSFNNDYCIEIESMAKTINVDPLWLYALNARSEIMNRFANECTALYFKTTKLLGQNWDWASELEELVYLANIQQDNKPAILQLMEPGIIGKIGFNSAGLGVCLNFLHLDGYFAKGVPIHVLLRGILDCNTIDQARNLVETHATGLAANVLVADRQGNFFDIECAGDESFVLDSSSDQIVHTNHYCAKNINSASEEQFYSSYNRFNRANELVAELHNPSLHDFKRILLDSDNNEFPICRPYRKAIKGPLNLTGTICSLIMDLQHLDLYITRGNPFENPFEKIHLSN